jgi:hypothetical protein
VYTRPSILLKLGELIKMTFLNVLQRHIPFEDAKFKLQRFHRDFNYEGSVVYGIEQEEEEEK